MTLRYLIAMVVFIFLIIMLITIIKKEFLVMIYNVLKDNVPGYARKILYVVIIILILFLIVIEVLKYFNINIFNYI